MFFSSLGALSLRLQNSLLPLDLLEASRACWVMLGLPLCFFFVWAAFPKADAGKEVESGADSQRRLWIGGFLEQISKLHFPLWIQSCRACRRPATECGHQRGSPFFHTLESDPWHDPRGAPRWAEASPTFDCFGPEAGAGLPLPRGKRHLAPATALVRCTASP